MRIRPAVVVLSALLLSCAPAFARDWFVAPAGNDGNDGALASPLATLPAALNRAQPGDTIQLRAGKYTAGVWTTKAGSPDASITVRAYDGDLTANQDAGVGLVACSYLRFQGIDFSVANGHCINVCGTSPSYHVYDKSHHVAFLHCRFHERDTDDKAGGDEVIKGSQSEYLLFEDCEVYVDKGPHTTTSFALDFVYVSHTVMRRFYIHDFNGAGIYTKGGSQYNVLEQSVISQSLPTSYATGIQTSDGTGAAFGNPDTLYETEYFVVRNNIIRRTNKDAIHVADVGKLWIYNNLFADIGDARALYQCYRPYLVEHDLDSPAEHCYNHSEAIRVFNNIFLDTNGTMLAAYGYDTGTATDWLTGNNCYWNNGKPVPSGNLVVDGKPVDPKAEPGAVFADPLLKDPTGTATTWQGWVDLYRHTTKSTALIDRGSSSAGDRPRPAVLDDIEGHGRPRGKGWDIGPYEFPGTYSRPAADFEAAATVGVPPFTVQFTDCTSGAPTSWSWDFGDGATSIGQHPSHTYAKLGAYRVRLTAANPAGKDARTRSLFIEAVPLVARFAPDPTWGAAPLTVQFADQSTASPTAWSWSFGDGATSTAQNPAHTYRSPGHYPVTLTARNAAGKHASTVQDAVAAYDSIVIAPERYELGAGVTLVSGAFGDVRAEDAALLTLASNPADGKTFAAFFAHTDVPRDRIQAIGYEVLARTAPEKTLNLHLSADRVTAKPSDFPWDYAQPALLGAPDQWLTRRETNLDLYLGKDGLLGVGLCGCPAGAIKEYTTSLNTVRFRLYLKPGAAPPSTPRPRP